MRVLISAGGTGGGVYPALAVAKAMSTDPKSAEAGDALRDMPPVTFLWVGTRGGMEAEIVARAGLPFKSIDSAGVHGVGWRLPLNALRLARGFFEALGLVRAFRPAVLLVTGGFVAVPVALAAWLQRVPVMIYVPDIEPGLALKFIARLARRIAVTAPGGRSGLDPRKVVVTGYPTRPEVAAQARLGARAEALAHFGLEPGRRTLLVTGGSRGARSLNRAVLQALPEWLKEYQVIHLTGQLDWAEVQQAGEALPADLRARYQACPYLHEMGLALAAADLVVSRAGASALGEYPLFGLPAVLVPYPYAWRYQKVNADYLVERGAALRLDDEALPARLGPLVSELLNDPERLARMRAAASSAARPRAAQRIAQELIALGGAARP